MALRALHTAGTGMKAFSFDLDVIANNLANSSTTGFKKERVNFEDLYYDTVKPPGAPDTQGNLAPIGIEVGLGTRVASTQGDFSEGNLEQTGGELDLAIVGDGFFQIQDTNGETVYTRAGTFTINADGAIVMASADVGRFLLPTMTVPPDATDISVSGEGIVSVLTAGSTDQTELGQIELSKFVNNQGLLRMGENLFRETSASGSPISGTPGQDGIGTINQGFLEASNVEPVRELVDLIKVQRNFELNTQVVQAADQLMQLIANLRRF
ncbi:flagellar basal-body rod protein FlgG [Calycomorphotria hydatis]|uniref:Flagellar basal-body rod protein FlgG n=1 Tax=Calycomorphotria hydatis TaxID=2528027 RepID=A0A517TCN5_9PLAN|nr:flagellar basal-body rod protein FlgG [Calycomorphotria hydatis]QDT66135.1 Flagellar basal-body rod protein FlgG [Calycomorphotria hydatis]